jgi:hypothetical protein
MLSQTSLLSLLTIALVLIHSAIGAPSADSDLSCNTLPRADPNECGKLMTTYSKNSTVVPCDDAKRVTFTQGSCSIVYKCPDNVKSIAADRVANTSKGLAYACREEHSPDHLVSAASGVKHWGRVCYMKAGK